MIWKRKDENIVDSSQFIFDDVFRNKKEKEEFANDPKYAYFKAISRIRNSQTANNQICKTIFKMATEEQPVEKAKNKQSHSNSGQIYKRFTRNMQNPNHVFNVQRINNHFFKIYKKKTRSFVSESQGLPDVSQINFRMLNHQEKPTQKTSKLFKSFVKDVPLLQDSRMKSSNTNYKRDTSTFQRYKDIKGIKRKSMLNNY